MWRRLPKQKLGDHVEVELEPDELNLILEEGKCP